MRQLVGYLRYDTEAERVLLNKIWERQALIGNHFYPQQKLVSKVRDGAKVSKKYDAATTPYDRIIARPGVKAMPKQHLTKTHGSFNPAAVKRQVHAPCDELLTLATAKNQPARKPPVSSAQADISREATNQLSRTS